MNIKKLLFGFVVFVTLQINAQNYLVSFEGKGASIIVTSVKVENLTEGTSLTLNGSDILSLTFVKGIDPIQQNHSQLKIFPNPMSDNSTLEFLPSIAGDARITIFDINGRPIAQVDSYLGYFRQNFRLSGLKQGFYLINVAGNGYKLSGRLISNGESDGNISIEKVINNYQLVDEKPVNNNAKGIQSAVEMKYSHGEMLKFTGISGDCIAVVQDIPTSNKTITFDFTKVPTLTTSVATAITSTSATSGGTITADGGTSVTAYGVCWSTTAFPTISLNTITLDGTGTGSFTSNITGLQPFTSYHIRAYATNSSGTAYGDDFTFATSAIVPSLTTAEASAITRTTARSGGIITSDGGATLSGSGICWGTSNSPSIAGSHTSDGIANGSFTSGMTDLLPNTIYYVRAYASNSVGTSYGNEISFTTKPIIISTLTTTIVSSITSATAVSGGTITDNGGASVTACGICWATTSSPTISDNITSSGTGSGSFTSNITGVQPETTYHVRAYATNSAGIAYGNEVLFTTNPVQKATLTTVTATSITSTTAISGGNIGNDGGGPITARGICWATTSSPTISDNVTSNSTGPGSFTSNITGLQPFAAYHVRAYATNSAGTAYGEDLTFTTLAAVPSLSTRAASSIARTTATSGGIITSNGGAAISVSGICWGTSHNPSIAGSHTSDGTANGSFTSSMTGLLTNTFYYIRAYATNNVGTSYGNELSFTTDPEILATLTTTAVYSIGSTTAVSGGNITDNGGATIIARGICWATHPSPAISDNFTSNGAGKGSFTGNLTGLTPDTRYYVRAYATNKVGTAYGNEVTFMFIIPEINTCKWLRDASCFLNLSFDDTQAAHLKIANLLDVYGFKGTFFIQSIELEYQPNLIDVYKSILLSGHEVGSHTVNHLHLPSLTEQQMLYEIDSSVSTINRYLNINCTSLGHPYHDTNDHINSVLFSHNLFTRDWSEYYSTRRPRFDLSSTVLVNDVTNFIDVQIANNNSCLIDGHGIDGSGYSPSTTEFFNQLFTYIANVQNNKKVWITTISNGALYESLFNEVMLTSNIDQSNRQIKIHFDCPNKPIYNNFEKLLYSFKINKSSSWSIQNSGIEYIETDTQYIFTIDLKQTRDVTLQYIVTN